VQGILRSFARLNASSREEEIDLAIEAPVPPALDKQNM